MPTNEETLDQLQFEILVGEILDKTKSGGLIWSKMNATQYRVIEIQDCGCIDPYYPDAVWEITINKVPVAGSVDIVLDLARNGKLEVSINASKVESITELASIVERIFAQPTRKVKKAIHFLQGITTVHDEVNGPPFTLRPNADLDDGWLRVPANGVYFDKIYQPVDAHDGDSSYVYDISSTLAVFGFDPLPDWSPDSGYTSATLRMAVKNISGTVAITTALDIEGPGVSSANQSFTESLTNGSYEIIELTWTRAFTKAEINHMKVQLNASASVNRVSAIELVVN